MMFQSQKHVFLNALILAIFIFAVGILLGYWFESLRVAQIDSLYIQSDLNLLDAKIMSDMISQKFNCNIAIQENIDFGNRVYEEARLLDRYENAQRISENIKTQHYKYDLLRAVFFINSLKIKKQCNASFHIVVYFYKYEEQDANTKPKQAVFSNVLMELKNKEGDNVILIPMAGDIDFSSIKSLIKNYNITSLPTILIDEKIKVEDVKTVADLEKLIK